MFLPPEVDLNRATLSMFPRPQVNNIVAFLKTLTVEPAASVPQASRHFS